MKNRKYPFHRFAAWLLIAALLTQSIPVFAMAAGGSSGVKITEVQADRPLPAVSAADQLTVVPAEDPDEIVDIIVELEQVPLAEAVPMRAAGTAQTAYQKQLLQQQGQVQAALTRTVSDEVAYTYTYTQLLNGFSVRTARKNLDEIQQLDGVKSAYVAGRYALPEEVPNTAQLQTIATAGETEFRGAGMTIAIVDTGLDTAHPAFSQTPDAPKFSKDYVRGILQAATLNAETLVSGLTADDVYISEKIPFAFDYECADANVAPGTKTEARNLNHGTHVAGIAGGYDVDEEGAVVFSGVAPDAQIIPMKVFDDNGESASSATVLAALEDAYTLGVDVVNLSLGTRSGFTAEADEAVNAVYDRLEAAGILVVAAAGNDTSASVNNSYGENLPLAQDPDNGIVGSPSSYSSVVSVASVNGDHMYQRYLTVGGEKFYFTDSTNSVYDIPSYVAMIMWLLKDPVDPPYPFVMVPGYGDYSDYEGIDVKGKIAVVQRGGDITFESKAGAASSNNAIAIIIYNNDAENPDDCSVNMDMGWRTLPACFVSYHTGERLAALADSGEGVVFAEELDEIENPDAGTISSFTSAGVTPDLRLKPEVAGIGGSVLSSVPTLAGIGDYEMMSGTSMASPQVAGVGTLLLQRVRQEWKLSGKAAADAVEALLMSTAQPVMDPDTEAPYTPRLQGSGLVDLNAALESPAYLHTEADTYGVVKPVVNLGDDVAQKGVYTIEFLATNRVDHAVTYQVSAQVMAPECLERDGYSLMGSSDVLLNCTVSGDKTVTLEAGESKTVRVTAALSEAQKAELAQQFANGIYVEGYVQLTAADAPALSLPFLGFFGDWSKAGMLDYATFLNYKEVQATNAATALGTWYSSMYAVNLGANLSTTEETSIRAEHLIISPNGDGLMDGVELVSLALLRSAAQVVYSVTDASGQEIWHYESSNVPKTSYYATYGMMITPTQFDDFAPGAWYGTDQDGNPLPDGTYTYTITAEPFTEHDSANVRNTVSFPVYVDTDAPTLSAATVTLTTNEDGRMILGLPVQDSHILLNVAVYPYYTGGGVNYLKPILNENFGLDGMEDVQEAYVELDVTDYAGKSVLMVVDDWGYNSSAYNIEIPASLEETSELVLSEDAILMFTDESHQLFCRSGDLETAKTVQWSSSNPDVASVDAAGVVRAATPGQTTITAKNANGDAAVCVVGVSDPLETTGLRLSYDQVTIPLYPLYTLTLPRVYLEPYGFEISTGDKNLVWTSSDKSVVDLTYSSNRWGSLKGAGTVTLTASYYDYAVSFEVEVQETRTGLQGQGYQNKSYPNLTEVLVQGDKVHQVSAFDELAEEGDTLSYTVENPEIIGLSCTSGSAAPGWDGPMLEALKPGITTITATNDRSGDSFSWMITVLPKTYTGIEGALIEMTVGDAFPVREAVTLTGDDVDPEYNPLFCTSFAPDIVTVDGEGTLTALKPGTALIRVMLNTGDSAPLVVKVTGAAEEETYTATVLRGSGSGRYAPGETVTIRANAAPAGMAFAGWRVDFGNVELADAAAVETTFVMPAEPVKVTATYEQRYVPSFGGTAPAAPPAVTAPALSFQDVPAGAWYYDSVKQAVEKGLIDGITSTRFAPEENLTVAQAIKLAAALHQLDQTGSVTLTNSAGDWYSAYVDYAVANGVIEASYKDYTRAQMNAPITRAEFVHIFHGAMRGYAAINTVADGAIPDVKTTDPYGEEIYTFYRAGILTGSDAKGTFHPATSIKRSEVAAILIRMFDPTVRESIHL